MDGLAAAVQLEVHNFTTNKYIVLLRAKTLNKGGFLWVQLQTKKLEVLYMRTVFISQQKTYDSKHGFYLVK